VRDFWSLEFDVGPGVLIPRPETETLIQEAIKAFPDRAAALDVLDLGTGTACLPITFLSEYPTARATAVDSSPTALTWARRNVHKHGMQSRCTMRINQWTDGLTGSFDVIFSNPPYIEHDVIATLDKDVAAYEPHSALDGGNDGLDAYREIAPRIAKHLKQSGRAFVELGAGQAAAVSGIFATAGLEIVRVVPDLAGIPRCLIAARAV
jgi:release factor glutamine methyltransferase